MNYTHPTYSLLGVSARFILVYLFVIMLNLNWIGYLVFLILWFVAEAMAVGVRYHRAKFLAEQRKEIDDKHLEFDKRQAKLDEDVEALREDIKAAIEAGTIAPDEAYSTQSP